MKKLISMFVVLSMIFCLSIPTYAADSSERPTFDSRQVAFDLEAVAKTGGQEYTVTDKNGNEAVVGVRFKPRAVPAFVIEHGRYDLTDGEWDIYYYSAVFNVSYNIMITNKKITDAYNLWYLFVGPSLDTSSLTYTPTKASAYFTFQTPIYDIVSWTGYLNAEIQGDELVVIVD